ncbi:MAG: hypothetical protein F6J87_21840 [Spirulina sp. SIO3F2]|nr:hypothetical protein [Spirulina sp. SIO3F2]
MLRTLCLIVAFLFLTACTASPLYCSNRAGHQICIIELQRSAKNYWEYRAQTTLDGIRQPPVKYDCRAKRHDILGQWVCDRFRS